MHYIHLLHLRAMAAPIIAVAAGFVIVILIWRHGSNVVRGIVAVALLIALVGYQVRKRMPPFEEGTHNEVVEAGTNPAAHSDAPHIGNCPAFPADNVWNTPIDALPKDKRSDDYIASIGTAKTVHPDFGSSLESGIPYSFIPAGTKRVAMAFDYREDSDISKYPIPPDAPIEGGASSTGDRHILLVDQRRCLLYETFDSHLQPDGSWKVGSGIIMDLTDNALRGDGKTSADAAGLPILPGLVRYDEVQAGEIAHALRFTIQHTQNAYIWPARHKASKISDVKVAPLGERFRLRANFDISHFSKTNQVILKALKKYGMLLADNGSSMYLTGVSDKRWDDGDLHKLGELTAADFEAVDESDYQMLADSARVDPLAVKR